ncbi:MAG: TraC family protein [Candidatus Paceibacterota bacterium]
MAVSTKSTQDFIPIKEIRDGVVILKDGSMRMIIMTSSLNFALKSADEQSAIIMQYQNFLNSLDFPIQFFIESRKLDIGPYLSTLQDAEKEQPNELLKIQTREYIEFIKNFVKMSNTVAKSFYVVVPYSMGGVSIKTGPLGGVLSSLGLGGKNTATEKKDIQFEEMKAQLQQRASVVQSGLTRTGVRTVALDTEELIELFYKLFNPGGLEKGIASLALGNK